ncbi:hypothetical protein QWY14_15860 [Planococcus sp. N028]|uniref:Uncharacterized protein n=1 Tax=Planococcus shixiaomingii TaxID=3058393 RepID=A0ABT8N5W6_9BACL|nr:MULTISPECIES: hypothetical protein [unclassified Planococcus (in: firmicutes)]MDN7243280.1 hypothetical protein [Planococcus sp. N028]WKA55222.1 hypothetical protein QWY21_02230 [Planococcus sp. N022]
MAAFQDKEQILMAYYAQYYRGATIDDVKALDERLRNGIGEERYNQAMNDLAERGLALGIDQVEEREKAGMDAPMATSEGMLYINNVLGLQSDAVEETILTYLEQHLETGGVELTLPPVKDYINESIQEHKKEKPNSNQP